MEAFGCRPVQLSLPRVVGPVGIDSAGLHATDVPMRRNLSTHWDRPDGFAGHFASKLVPFLNATQEGCSSKHFCPQREVDFFWLGKRKLPGKFLCYAGEECYVTLHRTSHSWFSFQAVKALPEDATDGLRFIPDPLVALRYTFPGPMETAIYFNEIRFLVASWLPTDPRPVHPDQRICNVDTTGIPDGLIQVISLPLAEQSPQ